MAEPTIDHPAFTWLMQLLASRSDPDIGNLEVRGRWVVSDGKRLVASGRNLTVLLESLSDHPKEALAVAFLRMDSNSPGGGSWDIENQPFNPGGTEANASESAKPEVAWDEMWEADHAAEAN